MNAVKHDESRCQCAPCRDERALREAIDRVKQLRAKVLHARERSAVLSKLSPKLSPVERALYTPTGES